MIGIVIVAHGGLAKELLKTVEHIVGAQPGMRAIAIEPDCNRDLVKADIRRTANDVDTGDGLVLVTDMFGGSPSNLCLGAGNKENRRIIYGTNLPLLIKLAKSRHLPVDEAVAAALMAGRKYLDAMAVSPRQAIPDANPNIAVAKTKVS